jgi:hypothetical protein
MIDGNKKDGFLLTCDNCGYMDDSMFKSFSEAVDYKQDVESGWKSIKDSSGEWYDLCPDCNVPDVIAHIKGLDYSDSPRDERDSLDSALKSLQ